MQSKATTSTLPPENQIQQNEWAVASASQALLGRVSSTSFAVGIALAAHVPFDGSRLTVWPSWTRIMFMCGIGSRDTLSRALQELEQHGLILVGRPKDQRKSSRYTLDGFVTVPAHVIERTLKAVEKASRSVERAEVRSPVSGLLRSPVSGPESFQCNSLNKEKKEREDRKGRGRHDPPPRASVKTTDPHPLSRAFEDKSPRPLAKPVECVEATEEGRRAWAKAKLLELAGPVATKRLGESGRTKEQDSSTSRRGGGPGMPDKRPWMKLGITRQVWLRQQRRKELSTITRRVG